MNFVSVNSDFMDVRIKLNALTLDSVHARTSFLRTKFVFINLH